MVFSLELKWLQDDDDEDDDDYELFRAVFFSVKPWNIWAPNKFKYKLVLDDDDDDDEDDGW